MTGKSKKIFMIYHGRFPAELGIAFFVAKMAEAFFDNGALVTILVPRRLGRTEKNCREYFGVESNFKVVFLPVLDLFFTPISEKITFLISLFTFSLSCLFYLFFKAGRQDIIHSNDPAPLLLASFFFPKTVYEVHNYPKAQKNFYSLLFKRMWKVIVTNRWKMEKIMEEFGLPKEKMTYESNAVDFKLFSGNVSVSESRKKFGLPEDKFIATYVGMLRTMGMEKGLSVVFSAMKKLSENFLLLLIGGTGGDISYYKDLAKKEGISDRVIFTGYVKNKDVPAYLATSDVLLAPFPKNDHYDFYMSPMKIFEYMASRRPIITTDLNSIREILGKDSAIFISPGNSNELLQAILKIEKDREFARQMSQKARREIEEHSWDKRAKRIIKFLG